MPTHTGTVSKLYQPSERGGKKSPAKLVLDDGQEFKSWERINAEIGQEVEVEYDEVIQGQYRNLMIKSIKQLSSNAGSASGGGSHNPSPHITNQTVLKAATEMVIAYMTINPGESGDWSDWECTLETAYQAMQTLVNYGVTRDPYA